MNSIVPQTQMMSSAGDRRSIRDAAGRIFALGGFRGFYRGLGVSVYYVYYPPATLTHPLAPV